MALSGPQESPKPSPSRSCTVSGLTACQSDKLLCCSVNAARGAHRSVQPPQEHEEVILRDVSSKSLSAKPRHVLTIASHPSSHASCVCTRTECALCPVSAVRLRFGAALQCKGHVRARQQGVWSQGTSDCGRRVPGYLQGEMRLGPKQRPGGQPIWLLAVQRRHMLTDTNLPGCSLPWSAERQPTRQRNHLRP